MPSDSRPALSADLASLEPPRSILQKLLYEINGSEQIEGDRILGSSMPITRSQTTSASSVWIPRSSIAQDAHERLRACDLARQRRCAAIQIANLPDRSGSPSDIECPRPPKRREIHSPMRLQSIERKRPRISSAPVSNRWQEPFLDKCPSVTAGDATHGHGPDTPRPIYSFRLDGSSPQITPPKSNGGDSFLGYSPTQTTPPWMQALHLFDNGTSNLWFNKHGDD
ncbi:hypothetical protein B0J11DRAFT_508564 [Dendryphion nanum]|uniref:Uncharacterized protein n=1 Tax=Dendryphion nanum TaxID=256645 RepID=A0A9P9DHY4_9PLEO|nr:hypothetical protein B0J11DRAFT_508564 [Dendryphion nanum]